ncbi:hypothetical protein RhiXN_03021 [Rhizoctonia solani]|uniref:Protein kinase domain-containing protein n=1 Tax=Rhizoctonia solani TaxID=456999 RepID=A0A8H8NSR8_9AGAM|nr:uncharacterized protein RhiXN_03021 [Rhizoctonia solani]QRW18097.1 hypothetical protein RhiXN_03021 [Rhizoctonia solani]
MAGLYDDDAISVTSDYTLPDADAVGFGAPLERMGFDHYALTKGDTSYSGSYYPSCEHLPVACTDPDCDCDDDAVFLGDDDDNDNDDDDEQVLSPCASSSSSLSEYFHSRRLSNAGDLAGVEHCDTPKATRRKFSTSFAAALAQGDALPPRPASPLEHPTMHNQRRIGTSDTHRHQLALARYLNADRTRADPWNHTHPVIHIREHTIANHNVGATLVTERLHDWWTVPFANAHDCIDYAKQILEGVAFLHEHSITNLAEAVRPHNIQMDVGLAPLAPPSLSPKPSGKSASAPATPAAEPDDLPSVAWTRADYPVRYYFTALGAIHRVRRHTQEQQDEEETEDDEMLDLAQTLDALSRQVDDDAWDLATAVDLVAVGNALDLVFGKMSFNPLRPIIQDLCDALDSNITAHDALARVESLEQSLSRHELFSPWATSEEKKTSLDFSSSLISPLDLVYSQFTRPSPHTPFLISLLYATPSGFLFPCTAGLDEAAFFSFLFVGAGKLETWGRYLPSAKVVISQGDGEEEDDDELWSYILPVPAEPRPGGTHASIHSHPAITIDTASTAATATTPVTITSTAEKENLKLPTTSPADRNAISIRLALGDTQSAVQKLADRVDRVVDLQRQETRNVHDAIARVGQSVEQAFTALDQTTMAHTSKLDEALSRIARLEAALSAQSTVVTQIGAKCDVHCSNQLQVLSAEANRWMSEHQLATSASLDKVREEVRHALDANREAWSVALSLHRQEMSAMLSAVLAGIRSVAGPIGTTSIPGSTRASTTRSGSSGGPTQTLIAVDNTKTTMARSHASETPLTAALGDTTPLHTFEPYGQPSSITHSQLQERAATESEKTHGAQQHAAKNSNVQARHIQAGPVHVDALSSVPDEDEAVDHMVIGRRVPLDGRGFGALSKRASSTFASFTNPASPGFTIHRQPFVQGLNLQPALVLQAKEKPEEDNTETGNVPNVRLVIKKRPARVEDIPSAPAKRSRKAKTRVLMDSQELLMLDSSPER